MTGGTAPGILTYIRYHADAEATAQIRQKHPSLQLPDDILRQVIADTRILAGTNPAMATSGFTGRVTHLEAGRRAAREDKAQRLV